MVFGWGKKKDTTEEKVDAVEPINSEITLSEIPKILADIEQLRAKTLVSEIKVFRNKIDNDRKNLLSIVSELKNADLKTGDIDNHLKIILNRAVTEVSSTIQNEFQTPFAEIKSLNDVFEFEKKATKAIKKVVDVLRKHKTGIALFAKKYARKFKDDLEILDGYLQEIKNLTSNYKSNQEFLSIINENLKNLTHTREKITAENKRNLELDNSLKQEYSKLDDLTKTESKIKSSSEYNDYIETMDKLASLSPQEKKLRYNLDEHFVKISRPLNKYVHISSLDKPIKLLHEKLIESPYDVLTENNMSDIVTILDSVKSAISSGAISVKDIDKSIEQLSNVKQILPNLINEKERFFKIKSIYLENLKKFDSDSFQSCKNALEKSENEISSIKSKQTSLTKQIEENEKLVSEIFHTLEINLKSASAISYKITPE